jgi:Cobalamin adenosyltransferase
MEAIGSVDELNAAIGFAAAVQQADGDPVPGLLESAQQDLLVAGTELMAPSREGSGKDLPRLANGDVARLEAAIDDLTARLPGLRNFILPGGSETAAACTWPEQYADGRNAASPRCAVTRTSARTCAPNSTGWETCCSSWPATPTTSPAPPTSSGRPGPDRPGQVDLVVTAPAFEDLADLPWWSQEFRGRCPGLAA